MRIEWIELITQFSLLIVKERMIVTSGGRHTGILVMNLIEDKKPYVVTIFLYTQI